MAFCTECGSKLPENAQFCTNCGTRQSAFSFNTPQKSEAEEAKASAAEAAGAEQAETQETKNENTSDTLPESEKPQLHYYTPPQSAGGFVPPYKPGAYNFTPEPNSPPQYPKKKRTGLIVAVSIVGFIIIALALLLIFTPTKFSEGLLGYWEVAEIDFGNGNFVDEYLGNPVKATMGLQINDDGTMYLGSAYKTEIIEGTWQKSSSGSYSGTLNGAAVHIGLSEDNLVLLDAEMAIIFERSSADISSPTIPFGSLSGKGDMPQLPAGEHKHEGEGYTSSVAGSGDVANGNYHVSVVGAERITDINDKPGLRIYYEFTNNSDYSVCAWDVLDYEATQDGKTIRSTYTWDETVDEYYNHNLNIRPGITILCFCEYSANLSGGSVDFTIFGWNDGKSAGSVTATYAPDALPGRPAPYVIKPVAEPQWTLSVPASATLDGVYDVSVGDADLMNDAYGDPCIRVYYTFKNNSAQPASLAGNLFCFAYQDGVQLDESYAIEDNDSDSMSYTEIKPGESVSCSIIYRLRNSESPVEAEVEASQTYDAVGQTYYIN